MDALLSRLLEASLQGVIAFVAVLVFVTIFKGLSPAAKCWLWRLSGLKLLFAFAFIVGVPLLPTSTAPVEQPPIPSFPTEQLVASATEATTNYQPLTTTTPNWPTMLIFFWGIGAVGLFSVRLTKELRARSEIFGIATPISLESPGRFFVSPAIQSPLVVGLLRPTIVLPTQIVDQPEELAMAVAHESAHIQRRDVLWQAILSLTSCAFWFLPPVHWISSFAKGEAEFACDQAVLTSTGTSPSQYARFLVQLAKQPSTITTLCMAAQTRHQLSRRIQAMNIQPRPRRAVLAAITILSLPALIPWQAVAQGSSVVVTSVPRLDKLAKQYLFLPKTERELGITQEQQVKLDAHMVKAGEEWRAFRQKLEDMKRQGMSDKDRIAYDKKTRMPMHDRNRNERWTLLTPSQQNRQRQLTLQYFGPMILGNPDVAKLINLPESSRGRINEISLKYRAFMKAQEDAQFNWTKEQVWGREIRIRDFTTTEKQRMAKISKAIYTAEGKVREQLWKEYYEIRRRGIKIEAREIDHDAYRRQLVSSSKELMEARRKEFAMQSIRADALIPESSRKKWQEIQGKLFKFEPWEIEGQPVISYR